MNVNLARAAIFAACLGGLSLAGIGAANAATPSTTPSPSVGSGLLGAGAPLQKPVESLVTDTSGVVNQVAGNDVIDKVVGTSDPVVSSLEGATAKAPAVSKLVDNAVGDTSAVKAVAGDGSVVSGGLVGDAAANTDGVLDSLGSAARSAGGSSTTPGSTGSSDSAGTAGSVASVGSSVSKLVDGALSDTGATLTTVQNDSGQVIGNGSLVNNALKNTSTTVGDLLTGGPGSLALDLSNTVNGAVSQTGDVLSSRGLTDGTLVDLLGAGGGTDTSGATVPGTLDPLIGTTPLDGLLTDGLTNGTAPLSGSLGASSPLAGLAGSGSPLGSLTSALPTGTLPTGTSPLGSSTGLGGLLWDLLGQSGPVNQYVGNQILDTLLGNKGTLGTLTGDNSPAANVTGSNSAVDDVVGDGDVVQGGLVGDTATGGDDLLTDLTTGGDPLTTLTASDGLVPTDVGDTLTTIGDTTDGLTRTLGDATPALTGSGTGGSTGTALTPLVNRDVTSKSGFLDPVLVDVLGAGAPSTGGGTGTGGGSGSGGSGGSTGGSGTGGSGNGGPGTGGSGTGGSGIGGSGSGSGTGSGSGSTLPAGTTTVTGTASTGTLGLGGLGAGASGVLADTGSDLTGPISGGLALLLAGSALLFARRRRTQQN